MKTLSIRRCAVGLAAFLGPLTLRAEPKVTAATQATVTKTANPGAKERPAPAPAATVATADQRPGIGGHLGVAVPFVTVQGYTSSSHPAAPLDRTVTLSDQFTLAFPIGVSIKTSRRLTVDFEVIVSTPMNPTGATTLTIDPGVIYDWGPLATGLRLAFPVGAEPVAIGLIPLINRGIAQIGGATWFVEADFPTVYHGSGAPVDANTTGTNSRVEWSAVLHTGFGF